jgi:hypothetical protein
MARLFGTDGVRGLANRDLTAELATALAQGAAIVLGEDARNRGIKPKAVIGRDPRVSGEFLAAAISAGLASSGVDVFDAGVLPTPATAFLTADLDADFGVTELNSLLAVVTNLPTKSKTKSKPQWPAQSWPRLVQRLVTCSALPMPRIATSCTCCATFQTA